ncbi:plant glycogenin-like starch initiation protein [Striga asiatica]|uniref:Hexosyltransferase n=1 Tax=Striga asiatica TaxID=4170 RepID=A0A5A7P9J2_STRAF|nr:plant glycogenin-like starch initiation protein [Striga asiatica]
MESRQHRSVDDTCRRKLQRMRVKSNPLKCLLNKANRFKFHSLKLLLIVILAATFITIFSFPSACPRSSSVSRRVFVRRWLWGGPDPRYVSDLVINWDEITNALNKLPDRIESIGLVNFDEREIQQWKQLQVANDSKTVSLHLDSAQSNLTWESLYPEWIDEEQEEVVPTCPSLPHIEIPRQRFDLIAVKLPCRGREWSRDVARLHLQISAARLAAATTRQLHLLFLTNCFPMPNLFPCRDLVMRQGDVWLYRPRLDALREKLRLPVGSCELALPLGSVGDRYHEYWGRERVRREAYATILHSAHDYVCGAIAAAQSIRMSGSTRDLVILVDETISGYHRSGLEMAGWKVRTIARIRNPRAEKDAYNEWNYSKFRLWQLTDYDRIIFIDADLLILRNIDFLFGMPQISATGNNGTLFNSGVMVIEPSNCTFRLLMDHINEIESYNGGDQGYLNEIFTWWHRLPKHVNFLKNFWAGDDDIVRRKKVALFKADPPILYVLHYLGNKPWMCFRDYDCNWNVDILREFASDEAHAKWWRVHDAMPDKLKEFCLLASKQKAQLEWDRRQAEKGNYSDGHWRIKVRDERVNKCIDQYCNWRGMLRHWGETNWTDSELPVSTPPALSKS